MSLRDERAEEFIKHLAAEFLQRESNGMSLITVTNVQLYNKRTRARILFTVLPEHKQPEAVDFANRKRNDFKDYVKKNARLQKLPQFEFAIDLGEKNRQRIDELSQE